jgi:hypothetical protein
MQETNLTLATGISSVSHIGVSTSLFFLTLIHLIALLLVMLVLFSVFSMVTNVLVSKEY